MTYTPHPPSMRTPRQIWMATLARASCSDIETLLEPVPAHEVLKAPETGTVMVEGRAGGAGRRFNLGEATVTRCVVRLPHGRLGFSYALGRDGRKARLAALLDARLQDEEESSALHRAVAALAEAQQTARELASRKAAATKVDFFTMVRGA